ncbi:hypothetical protein EJB05_22753, partial [Eragrostis curvula]
MANPSSATADVCAICLSDLGRGQTLITAECSHVFHLRCISENVSHGRRDCPLCKATWRDVPVVEPAGPYADDEPIAEPGVQQHQAQPAVEAGTTVTLKTHCERPAVPRAASRDGFAVLVRATAPGATAEDAEAPAPRAPLDLVTVLDVSGSMDGNKLDLVKQAMGFVVDNLGPADRLSVVSFSNDAQREIRLTRMSADGKEAAKRAVEALVAGGGTNIRKGLDVAAQVLAARRYTNAVTSVILLSDGKDNCNNRGVNLMPPSLRGGHGAGAATVHTFGFGTDHDAAAMHAIAEATRGTFSYIVNHEVVQDSFAQCIGGLLSVAMQAARLDVACAHPGVRVREVKSGLYENHVDADGRAASVQVGDLYADEVRRFLFFVDVPASDEAAAEEEEVTNKLLTVRCTYTDAATARVVDVAGEDAVVRRPVELLDGDDQPSVEVERERVRVAAAEDMAAAREAAERGDREGALHRLRVGHAAVLECAIGYAAYGGDEDDEDECLDELEQDMDEMQSFMVDEEAYEEEGRARLLSGVRSHQMQRASFQGGKATRKSSFQTKAMKSMVTLSAKSRRKQQPEESSSAPAKRRRKHK